MSHLVWSYKLAFDATASSSDVHEGLVHAEWWSDADKVPALGCLAGVVEKSVCNPESISMQLQA